MGMAKVREVNSNVDIIKRKVVLCGVTDIMFDRYAGDNKTQLEPHQKLYLSTGDKKIIYLPAANIMSALTAHNTNSFPKRLRDKRIYKGIANACLSFVSISPQRVPFTRDGKPIALGVIKDDVDPVSGIYLHRSVARLDKGIPNPKVRPVLPCPWELAFELTIFPNKEIKEVEIQNLFEDGGIAVGLGTFRGVFGKFRVEQWD